jgi:hypothetical protein
MWDAKALSVMLTLAFATLFILGIVAGIIICAIAMAV